MAPYGEGGAGVGISSVSGIGGADQTKAGFAGVAGAGVEFYLGAFLVGADLKYLWLDPGSPRSTHRTPRVSSIRSSSTASPSRVTSASSGEPGRLTCPSPG